jgi:hypothetical protein
MTAKNEKVSVWIGNCDTRKNFLGLLEYSIDDQGNFVRCQFCSSLGISDYDPDKFGGRFFPKKIKRPKLMFHGTEFCDAVESRIEELPASNCCVLLYDFEYDGSVGAEFELEGHTFQYLGSFPNVTPPLPTYE